MSYDGFNTWPGRVILLKEDAEQIDDQILTTNLNRLARGKGRISEPVTIDPDGHVRLVALIEFGHNAIDGRGTLALHITDERRSGMAPMIRIQIISYVKSEPTSDLGGFSRRIESMDLHQANAYLTQVEASIKAELGSLAA